MLSKYPPLLAIVLIASINATYIPELKLATTSDFLNWQLGKNGPAI